MVTRIDENTISVTKDGWDGSQVVEVTNEYKLDFLQKQLTTIQEQKEREMTQRDKEIDEVKTLLSYFE